MTEGVSIVMNDLLRYLFVTNKVSTHRAVTAASSLALVGRGIGSPGGRYLSWTVTAE
jgi:hypothetical protein